MLDIINIVVFGALFGIWQKSSMLNLAIKMFLLGLFVANIARLAGKI